MDERGGGCAYDQHEQDECEGSYSFGLGYLELGVGYLCKDYGLPIV